MLDLRKVPESSEIEEGTPLALTDIGCTLIAWWQIKTYDLGNDKSFTVVDHTKDLSLCRENAFWFV
jgi:hypothetical protein